MISVVNVAIVKDLFNLGKLTIHDADFYFRQGYDIICGNGKVERVEKSCLNV